MECRKKPNILIAFLPERHAKCFERHSAALDDDNLGISVAKRVEAAR